MNVRKDTGNKKDQGKKAGTSKQKGTDTKSNNKIDTGRKAKSDYIRHFEPQKKGVKVKAPSKLLPVSEASAVSSKKIYKIETEDQAHARGARYTHSVHVYEAQYGKKGQLLKNAKYVKTVSWNQFRTWVQLNQRNNIIKDIRSKKNLSYKDAVIEYNRVRDQIREDRIKVLASQEGVNIATATAIYNDYLQKGQLGKIRALGSGETKRFQFSYDPVKGHGVKNF